MRFDLKFEKWFDRLCLQGWRHKKMSKSKKREKRDIYSEIRKPTPKPGYAFASKKRIADALDLEDLEAEDWMGVVDQKTIERIKHG